MQLDLEGMKRWGRVFWRSLYLQAVWNYRSLQNIGFAWLMGSVLRACGHRDGEVRARKDHMGFFNTNPVLSTFVAGAVAKAERDLDEGTIERTSLESLKSAVATSLASKGDRLFWAGLKPLAVLTGSAAAVMGAGTISLALMLVMYAPLQLAVRMLGAPLAYRHGSMWLAREFGQRLETAALVLGCILAMVFGVFLGMVIAESTGRPHQMLGCVIAFGIAGAISGRRMRETAFVCGCLLLLAGVLWRLASW